MVTTHQDSTFLYVDPPSHLLGFWFALEDATVENGCLYFIPGSHNSMNISTNSFAHPDFNLISSNFPAPPISRFVRNPNPTGGNLTMTRGDELTTPLDEFTAVPVAKGSLVLIHGNVIHRSERNTSEKSRHAYTFHIVDFDKATYSPENW
jgi:phytanoyl-CoA hydroxylase